MDVGTVHLMTSVQYAQVARRPSVDQHQHYQWLQSVAFTDELLLLRHGERLDHVDRAWRNTTRLPENDPPLSTAGRRQALETGLMFLRQQQRAKVRQRAQGMLSFMLVSPFHRCIETALIVNLVGFHGKLAIFVDPLLSDWHSPKVFPRPPRLGGQYICTANTIGFRPKWETLGTLLVPFFRSILLDEHYALEETMVEEWITTVEKHWLRQEPSFLVWTSASARELLKRSMNVEAERTEHTSNSNRNSNSNSGGGNNLTITTTTTNNNNNNNNSSSGGGGFSGVSYPENASSLMRRVSEAIRVHFDGGAAERATVPACVWEAVQQEAQRLPRVFVPRSTATQQQQQEEKEKEKGKQQQLDTALLPPTRVMMVTHADVVSAVLKHCCPKYHGVDSGFSVPYCSLTGISRRNNFYCIKSDKLSSEEKSGNRKIAVVSAGEPPLLWSVIAETSTTHLQTTILLQYS
ncbi:uncharacterized protein TM35_000302040 [Trypanosoma theileri]|uniref:Phosphoglycerate mutase n=1 Tax=Trypanosoma theileri TaxID=67003 RepID=A0A1X0NN77_9TRYP|nr:uncharacterized protein TM35_000302040 [Trypanosoma theileri]ORC86164.1 hypothetical protein TM35_000302040 [Trypanosoma theileri]